jgi:hypothetical protein
MIQRKTFRVDEHCDHPLDELEGRPSGASPRDAAPPNSVSFMIDRLSSYVVCAEVSRSQRNRH